MKRMLPLFLIAMCLPGVASATGLLIPSDQSIGPLGIKYHRAEVKITDRVAVTKVDQVFTNSSDRDLEATFIFPLPKGATVSDFYLYMNGKKQKGEILEKNQARNIYEGIVRRMRDPGLLEYLDRDLFQAQIYPVPRRGEARIEIEFTQLMPFESGVIQYTYPMRTDRGSARTMQDFTMSVKIGSKVPIKAIYSPTHQIYSRKSSDHEATAGFETMSALLDRDFELFYTVSEKDIGLNLLAYRDPGEPGFFMLMISPKSDFQDKEIIGKRITFVVDTSGSMAGSAMKNAKAALKYCLNRLNPDDMFNLIRFSTDVEAFMKQPVSAGKDNVQQALNFVERMEAAGGTAIDEALTTALAGHTRQDEPNLVVFLTDGHPTVGETAPERIVENVRKHNKVGARMFVFGVGEDINTRMLDSISAQNSADSTYVKPDEELEQRLSGFYAKVSHPVLADLKLDFGSIHEYDVLPKQIPDLFKGSQVIAMGRYRNEGHAALTLTGLAGRESKKFVFEGAFPKEAKNHDFICRLWATRKIGFLLDTIRLSGQKQELVDEVIQLSKRYGIVTPYTSYLVTEDQPVVATPSPNQPMVPRPSPEPVWRTRPGDARPLLKRDAPASAGAPEEEDEVMDEMDMMEDASDISEGAGRRYESYKKSGGEVMGSTSGRSAVDMAQSVKRMKTATKESTEDDDAAGIRHISGYTFRLQGGAWVDIAYKSGMKTLEVKYLGKAYFELLQKSPLLKKLFSLGERITIVVGKDRALVISPTGQDSVSDSELKQFVP